MREKIASRVEERHYWLEVTEEEKITDAIEIRCRAGDPKAKDMLADYSIFVPKSMPKPMRQEFAELLAKHVKAYALRNI